MARRNKPNWCIYLGGPSNGERRITGAESGTTRVYTPGASPGRRVPHEYAVTLEYHKGAFNEGKSRILRYIGALPEEDTPPPRPTPSVFRSPFHWEGIARNGGSE